MGSLLKKMSYLQTIQAPASKPVIVVLESARSN
jgi:hypothetical protein